MVRKAHVSLDFNTFEPANKKAFGNTVILQLTLNAAGNFPNLPFTISQLTDANDDLEEKYNAFLLQGKVAEGALSGSEAVWQTMFTKTAMHVDMIADGSIATISLSGYHHTKTQASSPEIPGASASTAFGGMVKGTVRASIKKHVKDMRGFIYTVGTNDFEVVQKGNQLDIRIGDSFLSLIVSTKKKITFAGLPSRLEGKARI